MGRTRNVWVGLACGAALGLGGIVAVNAATESADAQGGFKVTPGQLQINQKISQAAVRRANRNRTDIEALQKAVGANGGGTGATGPQGPPGAPGVSGYEVVNSEPLSIAGNGVTFQGAACPQGKRALGGGVALTDAGGQPIGTFGEVLDVQGSYPTADGQWSVVVRNPTGTERFFRITVVCATVA